MPTVFERFTERARQAIVLSQEEALALRHNYIGTEHILLGVLREEEGLAARVLRGLNVDLDQTRAQVVRIIGYGDEAPATGQIPFTPRAKRVMELALREALTMGHSFVGTEHLLLGVVGEHDGVAAQILREFDADAEKIRNEMMRMLGGRAAQAEPPRPHLAARAAQVRARPAARRARRDMIAVAVGWGLALLSVGLGILIGWAIWGT